MGATEVRITLHPTSALRVRVVDANGQLVAKATARIETIGGTKAMFPGRTVGTTDHAGILELVAPEGLVMLFAEAEGRTGRTSVECPRRRARFGRSRAFGILHEAPAPTLMRSSFVSCHVL